MLLNKIIQAVIDSNKQYGLRIMVRYNIAKKKKELWFNLYNKKGTLIDTYVSNDFDSVYKKALHLMNSLDCKEPELEDFNRLLNKCDYYKLDILLFINTDKNYFSLTIEDNNTKYPNLCLADDIFTTEQGQCRIDAIEVAATKEIHVLKLIELHKEAIECHNRIAKYNIALTV